MKKVLMSLLFFCLIIWPVSASAEDMPTEEFKVPPLLASIDISSIPAYSEVEIVNIRLAETILPVSGLPVPFHKKRPEGNYYAAATILNDSLYVSADTVKKILPMADVIKDGNNYIFKLYNQGKYWSSEVASIRVKDDNVIPLRTVFEQIGLTVDLKEVNGSRNVLIKYY